MFQPPKSTVLFTGLWRFIPPSILRYVEYLPMHDLQRLRHFLIVSRNTAKSVLEQKADSTSDEAKDMLSVLGEYARSYGIWRCLMRLFFLLPFFFPRSFLQLVRGSKTTVE